MDFESAYHANFKLVYRFLYYKDVDKGDIEDLAQEVFFRLYKKYDCSQMEAEHITKTAYAIARNVWLEWLRTQGEKRTLALIDDFDYVDSYEEFIQEELPEDERESERERLRACIKDLNPTVQKVLTLRYLEDKTRKETAAILQITEDQVHTYQKRGVAYLRKHFGKTVPPLSHT